MSSVLRRYGWRPDLPVHPSCKIVRESAGGQPLPAHVDNYLGFPFKPWDQGELGSCTAHMGAGLITYDAAKEKFPIIMPSRLMIYYDTRSIENTVAQDAGASISDTIVSLNRFGACEEALWPYDPTRFTIKPGKQCYTEGAKHRAITSTPVSADAHTIKSLLAEGYVIGLGISVYESFESDAVAKNGMVPWPKQNEALLGGHAVVICGYNDATQRYKVRNSWGVDWGDHGYFYLEYPYVHNQGLASDLQCIQTTNG